MVAPFDCQIGAPSTPGRALRELAKQVWCGGLSSELRPKVATWVCNVGIRFGAQDYVWGPGQSSQGESLGLSFESLGLNWRALVGNPILGLGLSSYEARTPSLGSILWHASSGPCMGGEHGASRRSLGRAPSPTHTREEEGFGVQGSGLKDRIAPTHPCTHCVAASSGGSRALVAKITMIFYKRKRAPKVVPPATGQKTFFIKNRSF